MKKLSYLLVAFALFSFIAVSSCKSSTKKPEAPQEDVMEESTSQQLILQQWIQLLLIPQVWIRKLSNLFRLKNLKQDLFPAFFLYIL